MSTPAKKVVLLCPYLPTDAAQLAALFYGSVHTVAARDYTPAQLDAWAPAGIDPEKWCAPFLHSKCIVAMTEDARIVGFGNLYADGYLDRLYVHKDCQRRGIGRRIADYLEKTAQSHGLARVYTDASLTARCFFEARGYTLLRAQEVVRQGVVLRNFCMEKRFSK